MITAIRKIALDGDQMQALGLMRMPPPAAINACLLFLSTPEALRYVVFECGPDWQALYIYVYSSDCAVGIPFHNLGMQHGLSMRLLATVLGDLFLPFLLANILLHYCLGREICR
jgi:hypothetical protein